MTAPISVSATTKSAAEESHADGTAVRPAMTSAGKPGDRRQPLVGEKHDLDAALMRLLGEADEAVLVAPDVEDHQNVALAHVDQPVAPHALLAGEVKDIGLDDGKMGGHVTRQRIGEAAADQERLAAPLGKPCRDVGKLLVGQVPEGLAHIVKRCFQHRRHCTAARSKAG